jgi:branched-chain amino acid transport system substrate-binding protein
LTPIELAVSFRRCQAEIVFGANLAAMNRARAAAILSTAVLAPLRARAQGAAPYKLGVSWPLTGPLAPVAVEFLKGAELAVADVNKAGGVKGHPLQLVVEDSAGTPQGGITAMRKLAQVDGVQAMMTIFTNVVTAQIPLADQLKIPTISTVESPGLFAKSTYSFSHAPTWATTLPQMTAYWKAHDIKRVYGLLTNSAIGQIENAALRTAVQAMGGEYGEALIDPDATDFRGPVERARDANAQIVMITGQGSTVEAQAIKQVREAGLRAQIWSFGQNYTSKGFHDAVGPYGEGMVCGGLYLDPNVSNGFARAFRAKVGYLPAYISGEWYDIVKMYAYAIGKGGYNGDAIREVIATLKGVPSVLGGTIKMGPDHYSEFGSTGLWLVRAGKLIRLPGTRSLGGSLS